MPRRVPGLFVTGTDTGVGKTYVAALIARSLAAGGHRVGIYKPAASGCRYEDRGLIADDAVALWNAAGRPADLEHVCPQRFAAPLAPHLAARIGRQTTRCRTAPPRHRVLADLAPRSSLSRAPAG